MRNRTSSPRPPPPPSRPGRRRLRRLGLLLLGLTAAGAAVLGMRAFDDAAVSVVFVSNLDGLRRHEASEVPRPGDGVDVFLGKRRLCRTPCSQAFSLAAAPAELTFSGQMPGFFPVDRTVSLGPDDAAPVRRIAFYLKPIPQDVTVRSDPPGATIFINGISTGLQTPATLMAPRIGTYDVTLELEGHHPHTQVVEIEPHAMDITLEVGPALPAAGAEDPLATQGDGPAPTAILALSP